MDSFEIEKLPHKVLQQIFRNLDVNFLKNR